MKKRIFSGAQPTGQLHIGNYLGALKNWVALQNEYESFFCIVNLHALTLPQDPKVLRQKTLDLARIYLAAGIDTEKSTVFIQSDVPEHAELTWILSCISRMGELERMTQFKDKGKGNTERAGVGLFTYPVLMAADILLYQTDLVPIGQDQKQHLELTRDLAERFNRDFGETFVVPDAYIPPAGAKIMSLADPTKKMSKSDEDANGSILLLDDADTVTKKIKRAVTDSGTEIRFDDSRPAITNLLTIYHLLTGKSVEESEAHFSGKGYGQFKSELAETVVEFLRPFQDRVKHFDDETLLSILKPGAEKARTVASETLKNVYAKTGII
ncbi:MAG TPA: tryptophan--tRNA ligase [Pyrinomonadaceae bacterium]|jgi:tryptophanyl-tRNA synthetase|nr:tryptophan--tRNA ligase [Pyrinomonadaceae bacterium]